MKFDARNLKSQRLRSANFQGDALRMGMNWTEEDLAKPQILVDSAYGMGHPGTFHFRPLIEEISNGVFEAGGKPGVSLIPAPLTMLLRYARAAGKQILRLVERDIRPRDILTREAFENAVVLHAAVGGSTNALLHRCSDWTT